MFLTEKLLTNITNSQDAMVLCSSGVTGSLSFYLQSTLREDRLPNLDQNVSCNRSQSKRKRSYDVNGNDGVVKFLLLSLLGTMHVLSFSEYLNAIPSGLVVGSKRREDENKEI